MPDSVVKTRGEWGVAFEVMAAGLGMFLFGLLVHERPPFLYVAPAGLLMVALALAGFFAVEPSPAAALGLARFGRRAAAVSGVGIVIGLAVGLLYRTRWGWPVVPRALTGFTLLFALIGATEELLYRGYIQGRLRCWFVVRASARRALPEREMLRPEGRTTTVQVAGPVGAVCTAAFCHALYKFALLGMAPEALAGDTDPVFLVVVTFFGGLGFGALRELSGSVAPPVLAHVVFDIVVYGERAAAPWWVWS